MSSSMMEKSVVLHLKPEEGELAMGRGESRLEGEPLNFNGLAGLVTEKLPNF
jgi:hypothetical protein